MRRPQAVYTKYGVNPMGSCLQLIIQMPILFALYQVIWNVPAYVSKVRDAFIPLAEALIGTNGAQEYLTQAASSLNVSFKEMTNLTVVDVLYKFRPSNWTDLAQNFPGPGGYHYLHPGGSGQDELFPGIKHCGRAFKHHYIRFPGRRFS